MVLCHDKDDQIIEFYKFNQLLWYAKDRDYKNKAKRNIKLDKLAARIGNTTRKEISERFRNLRTTYAREHKKVNCKKSDEGTDDVYVSKWKHYNSMLFLRDTIVAENSISIMDRKPIELIDIEKCDFEENNTSQHSISRFSTPISSNCKRKKVDPKTELYIAAAKRLSSSEEKDDEELAFCRSLACSLRRLHSYKKEIAKLEIQQVIVKYAGPEN